MHLTSLPFEKEIWCNKDTKTLYRKAPKVVRGHSSLTNTIDRLILPNSKHKDPHTPT